MDWLLALLLTAAGGGGAAWAWRTRRRPDPVLWQFQGDPVTLTTGEGREICGRLDVHPTGLEVAYDAPRTAALASSTTSYILYREELPQIQILYRFHDRLNGRPAPGRGWPRPWRGDYDPLLDKLRGHRVVARVEMDQLQTEFQGVLQAYSPDFLRLAEVAVPYTFTIGPQGPAEGDLARQVAAAVAGMTVRVTNAGPLALVLRAIEEKGMRWEVGQALPPGETVTVALEQALADHEIRLILERERRADLILPRRSTRIRHRSG